MTAPALGPLLGGILVDQGMWRWIFFVNVPIGVFGVWLGARWLREWKQDARPHLDVVGLLLALIAFGSLLYAYRLTFYVSLLAVAIALFLPGWPGQWTGREGLQAATAA